MFLGLNICCEHQISLGNLSHNSAFDRLHTIYTKMYYKIYIYNNNPALSHSNKLPNFGLNLLSNGLVWKLADNRNSYISVILC